MSMPSRWATCQMVSPVPASTSRPSRVNFTLLLIASPLIYRLVATVARIERSEIRDCPIHAVAPLPGFADAQPGLRLQGGQSAKRVPTGMSQVGTLRFAHPTASSPLPTSERRLQLLREVLQHADQWIWRRLPESANRGVPHGGRQFVE